MGLIPTLRGLRGAATCPDCGAEREQKLLRDECGNAEVINDDAGESHEADFTRESEWRPLR